MQVLRLSPRLCLGLPRLSPEHIIRVACKRCTSRDAQAAEEHARAETHLPGAFACPAEGTKQAPSASKLEDVLSWGVIQRLTGSTDLGAWGYREGRALTNLVPSE